MKALKDTGSSFPGSAHFPAWGLAEEPGLIKHEINEEERQGEGPSLITAPGG